MSFFPRHQMQLPLTGERGWALSHPQSRADASVRITDATNTALPWSPSVCVCGKTRPPLLSHSRHIPQARLRSGKPLASLPACVWVRSAWHCRQTGYSPILQISSTPTLRDSALPQEQATPLEWAAGLRCWGQELKPPQDPGVAEVEAGLLLEECPTASVCTFQLKSSKHKAFLFPLSY